MKVKNSLCSCRSVASMKKRSLWLYERAESMSSEKEIKKLNQWDHEHVEKTNPTLLYNTILSANFKIPSKTEKILKTLADKEYKDPHQNNYLFPYL